VSEDTVVRWRRSFAGFAASYTHAQAIAELRCVATIQKAATDGDWKAALAWLERRRPEDWGKKETIKVAEVGSSEAVLVEQKDGGEVKSLMESLVESGRLMRKALELLERQKDASRGVGGNPSDV